VQQLEAIKHTKETLNFDEAKENYEKEQWLNGIDGGPSDK